jgi:hypothetical protein
VAEDLKVGDLVRMNARADKLYTQSKGRSLGVVDDRPPWNDEMVHVRFFYLTGDRGFNSRRKFRPETFGVLSEACDRVSPDDLTKRQRLAAVSAMLELNHD